MGIAHQIFEQLKFPGLQSGILISVLNLSRNKIHLKVANSQHALVVVKGGRRARAFKRAMGSEKANGFVR